MRSRAKISAKTEEVKKQNRLKRFERLKRCGGRTKRNRKQENPIRYMLARVRCRAKQNGFEYNLEESDIVIPQRCPVLGIPIRFSVTYWDNNSPSIDRINNRKGYTKDNIMIVSLRANVLKRDATPDEMMRLARFYWQIRHRW